MINSTQTLELTKYFILFCFSILLLTKGLGTQWCTFFVQIFSGTGSKDTTKSIKIYFRLIYINLKCCHFSLTPVIICVSRSVPSVRKGRYFDGMLNLHFHSLPYPIFPKPSNFHQNISSWSSFLKYSGSLFKILNRVLYW